MKRNLYLIFALLFAATTPMSAQHMIVSLADGGEVAFNESSENCKITFSGGQMLFHVNGAVKNTLSIKNIMRISFQGVEGSVDAMPGDQVATYSSDTEELHIKAQPGISIAVYQMDGSRVLHQLQSIASSTISVAHLPAGAYIVVAGSETLKFVKQ